MMKGEYQEEEKQDHHHHIHHQTNNTNMFYKLQQQQTQTFHHHTQNQPQPTFHHPFHIAAATTTTTQTSEEADSHRSPTHTTSTTPKTTTSNKKRSSSSNNPSSHDGATIEVIRRPRGRPPGSKNKAKPPIIITKEPEPSMSPYVLELPPNVDIIQSVFRFCHKRNINLCIFNGSGSVTNVTLHQPSSTPGATVTFHGRFDILSISATILPNNNKNVDNSAWPSSFTITLSGPQGQVFGGAVMGPLASAGTIYLIASTFDNPTYQRLPFDDNNEARNNALVMSDGGGGGGDEGQRHHSSSGGGGSGDNQMAGMYSNFQADVIWAPVARPPPPY